MFVVTEKFQSIGLWHISPSFMIIVYEKSEL
jgi:hypothetical protein